MRPRTADPHRQRVSPWSVAGMCRCHLSKRARCRSPSYSAFLRLRRSPPCVFSLRLAWRSALGLQISCHRGVPSTTPPHQMARRCADGACPRLKQGLSWRDTRTAGTAAHVPPSLTKPWQPARDTRPSPRSLDWANATGSRWHTTHDQYPVAPPTVHVSTKLYLPGIQCLVRRRSNKL